ncbi:chloride channel protein [Methylotuvimicrobium alcaliphilum]|uniref:H(+)/Cl(-) exchange transporter ClcA n=1 Tax=Methylotuvimicrobium alcaliphilum (strain DSM 19304 / NCIMB 14124 / VKM B-2133 / 20Z) TaxID=1091494 RepID=G4T1I8_META2|nr:chloride channel protein [Methylotuvimicrobium alcaliphilum]CCE22410.1 putative H(+)/Cl(-) exchange transporter ClcA [Methylotuvimicrobium alcaliphilum 20Z]
MLEFNKVFLSANPWKHRLVFWLGAIIIGVSIALMTLLSEWVVTIFRSISDDYRWFKFIAPPFGIAFTAWLTFRFFPGSQGSGIPQVKTALEIPYTLSERTKLVSLRIAIGKAFLPILGLLSGASVGFGGPATHVGASIMASLGKVANFPTLYMSKGLLLAGSAAGFAAMFSAPLAGIMFAIEEMGRALEERISTLVLTAIIFSGMTAYSILHYSIYFPDNPLYLPWGDEWLAIPFCGIVGGLLGSLFSWIIVSGHHFMLRLQLPYIPVAFICGCIIALIGFVSEGQTFGTGYQMAKNIMYGSAPMDPLLPVYKMLATCATFFSGIPGGLFVPSIAIGAGFGANLANWFPIAPASVMIMLTITAYFSGMLQSPLTSFTLILEITQNHDISIPIMAAAFIASGVSKLINPQPLNRALCDAFQQYLPEKTDEDDDGGAQ